MLATLRCWSRTMDHLFSSHEFISWCGKYGILIRKSPPYHPQSNGAAERQVQNVKLLLKKQVITGRTQDWKNIVRQIQSDLRFAHSPLLNGQSPAQLVYAYNPRTRFNLFANRLRNGLYYQ